MIGTLTHFYAESTANRFVLLVLFWLFWPGSVFIAGFIGESRLVPIRENQSIAFMPGDLSFGVMFVSLIGLYQQNEHFNQKLCIILFVPVLYFAWLMRRGDVKHYPKRARISPTKLTHDIIGYFIIPLTLLTLSLTKIYEIYIKKYSFSETFPNWLMIASAFMFYIICAIMDNDQIITPKQIYARHPYDWQPIWKTFPRE